MSSVVSTSSTERLSFRFTFTFAGGGVGQAADSLLILTFPFALFLPLSAPLTLTLLAGEVNNSERLLIFLFLLAEEALPEVSRGTEDVAADPKDRDRGIFLLQFFSFVTFVVSSCFVL